MKNKKTFIILMLGGIECEFCIKKNGSCARPILQCGCDLRALKDRKTVRHVRP
jgi:hypothetical protein